VQSLRKNPHIHYTVLGCPFPNATLYPTVPSATLLLRGHPLRRAPLGEAKGRSITSKISHKGILQRIYVCTSSYCCCDNLFSPSTHRAELSPLAQMNQRPRRTKVGRWSCSPCRDWEPALNQIKIGVLWIAFIFRFQRFRERGAEHGYYVGTPFFVRHTGCQDLTRLVRATLLVFCFSVPEQ